MKKISLVLAILFTALTAVPAIASNYKCPPLLNLLAVNVYLLPKELNKPLEFVFQKQDSNGRPASDELMWYVVSPSGENVCEGVFPDDGDTTSSWKLGPLQTAVVKFIPREKGVYTLCFQMECDARLRFDNAKAVNTYWGVRNNNFRSTRHPDAKKIHAWFYLPPIKAGGTGVIDVDSSYMHYSHIENMTIKSDTRTYYKNWTAPRAANRRSIFTHHFKFERDNAYALYEITADEFNVISFSPKYYSPLTWYFDKESAIAFRPYVQQIDDSVNSFNIPASVKSKNITLVPGALYRVNSTFKGVLKIAGKNIDFTKKNTDVIKVDSKNCFVQIDFPANAAGDITLVRIMSDRTITLYPVNGSVITAGKNGKFNLSCLEVLNAKNYEFELKHESGKTITLKSNNQFAETDNLIPGVWQFRATGKGAANFSAWSCFSVAKTQDTTPFYAYGFTPAMDSSVNSISAISLAVKGDAAQIDLARSNFSINGRLYAPQLLKGNRIGVSISDLPKGPVMVIADLYDKAGNYSRYQWPFMLGVPATKQISFNKDGILIFNGRKYLPLMVYPPINTQRQDEGFNVIMPNTFSHPKSLELLITRNLKTLDSGCVYRGYYTPKTQTVPAHIKEVMESVVGTHPARLGMWVDEADAYLPNDKILAHTQCYRTYGLNAGVAGICTTGRTRYADMAKLGDYLMIDIYPRANVLSVDKYFAKAVKDAAGKPVWQLNQGFDYNYGNTNFNIEPEQFTPTPQQFRYSHWAAFRHGLQGLGLYMCGPTKMSSYPKIYPKVVAMYQEAATLSFVLVEPQIKDIVTLNGKLNSRAIRYGDRLYIIVQNSSLQPILGKISVKGFNNAVVRVLFADRTVAMKNGTFQDAFQALDSRIYEIEYQK